MQKYGSFLFMMCVLGLSMMYGASAQDKPAAKADVITSPRSLMETEIDSSGMVIMTYPPSRSARFSHEGLTFYRQTTEDLWNGLVETMWYREPFSTQLRHYGVAMEKVSNAEIEWKKTPGYSLWAIRTTYRFAGRKQPPMDGDGFYITRDPDGKFVAIHSDSPIKAGLEVKGLKPGSDPSKAEKAVGPFDEREAKWIVEQFMTRTVKVLTLKDQPTFRVPRDWTAPQISEEVKKRYGTQGTEEKPGGPHNWSSGD